MNLFVWTGALATGNRFIDGEHQELVLRVNAVLESIALKQGAAGLGESMHALQVFVQEHFSHEEREMQHLGYADATAHRAAHTRLLEQLEEVHASLVSGQGCEPMELYRFLTWWVKDHIRDWDLPLAEALTQREPGELSPSV
jgi:hemerythrin